METGDPKDAQQAPGLTGGWMWLFVALLAASSVWAIRRHTAES
jgi:hypothetical protein